MRVLLITGLLCCAPFLAQAQDVPAAVPSPPVGPQGKAAEAPEPNEIFYCRQQLANAHDAADTAMRTLAMMTAHQGKSAAPPSSPPAGPSDAQRELEKKLAETTTELASCRAASKPAEGKP